MDGYGRCTGKRQTQLLNLTKLGDRLKKLLSTKKYHIFLIVLLILSIGVFFSVNFSGKAYAEQSKATEKIGEINPEVLDPMNKIKSMQSTQEEENSRIIAEEQELKKQTLEQLLDGYPMEAMIPYLIAVPDETAAFLVSIAKKESDWGRYSPQKNGNTCYNYWGYKGSYNLSPSGYSCFDSSEQAVEIAGNRISELIDKKINTPEQMVVWKCGSSCAGHDPVSVQKWISDVRLYWSKLSK